MSRPMTHRELEEWQREAKDFALLDLSPAQFYEQQHIPGALNHCVYEVTFVDAVRGALPNMEKPVVVYGASLRSRAAQDAAAKLAQAGYTDLRVFEGGLEEWVQAGLPVEGQGQELPEDGSLEAAPDKTYALLPQECAVRWFGSNFNSTHHGTIAVAGGELTVAGGSLQGGRVVLDVTSLANADLDDPGLKGALLAHLASEDFFETAAHPTAEVEVASVMAVPGAPLGLPNVCITAKVTIKGVSHTETFDGVLEYRPDRKLALECLLELDRTRYGVLYGSGRFYERLGMHLVHDRIQLMVRLVAQ